MFINSIWGRYVIKLNVQTIVDNIFHSSCGLKSGNFALVELYNKFTQLKSIVNSLYFHLIINQLVRLITNKKIHNISHTLKKLRNFLL